MNAWRSQSALVVGVVLALLASGTGDATAAATVQGSFYFDYTTARSPLNNLHLLESGLDLDIVRTYKLHLGLRTDYIVSASGERIDIAPLGDVGIDLDRSLYSLNLHHGRYLTISSVAEFTEMTVSRAALALSLEDLPRVSVTFSRAETSRSGATSTAETATVSGDYSWRWLNLRSSFSADRSWTDQRPPSPAYSLLAGVGGTHKLLPFTTLTADLDVTRFSSSYAAKTTTLGRTLNATLSSQPIPWLALRGGLSDAKTRTSTTGDPSLTYGTRTADASANVEITDDLTVSSTVGNRTFSDGALVRSVTFDTLAATFTKPLRPSLDVGLTASRTYESDPYQGRNTTSNVGLSANGDPIPEVKIRANLSINHSQIRSFVGQPVFDASGTLADRALYDDRPPGFTFYDEINDNLYTKRTAVPGDWVLTAHVEPITGQYAITRTVQINARPTRKSTLTVSWSGLGADDELQPRLIASQSVNASLAYAANRRTQLAVAGTAFLPGDGSVRGSLTGTLGYRFVRGHKLSLSYAMQRVADHTLQSAQSTMRMALRKRLRLELIASARQATAEQRSMFFRATLKKDF